jgi:hypothetical protein
VRSQYRETGWQLRLGGKIREVSGQKGGGDVAS